jgi:hypothetical protein
MAKTSQELVTRVMQKLTSLPPGEDPSAEDDYFVTEAWKSINDNLRSPTIKISSWTFDSIPNNVFEPVCQYVKEMLWEEYHGARDNNTAICEQALMKLRMTVATPYMGSKQTSDYY